MDKRTIQLAAMVVIMAGGALAVSMNYESSLGSAGKHQDTDPPSKLTDGRYNSAVGKSVEYRGDPELIFTLAAATHVQKIQVAYYHLKTAQIGRIELEISKDGQTWEPSGAVEKFEMASKASEAANLAEFQVGKTISAFRVKVFRAPKSKRVLLGEVLVVE